MNEGDETSGTALASRTPRAAPPLFLARDSYRHRRLIDAARLMPFFVAALWLVPMFWSEDQSTARGMIYLFGVWFVTIVVSALLARKLAAPLSPPNSSETARLAAPRD